MKRKSIKQRVFAAFLAASMVFTMTPMTSFAEEMDTDTVSEETQVQTSDSEAIEALQSRINALPTVDEFIALADGTTVEDSTLNQAQLDVYNEAQAITEEMDKLTNEEQGQLDTGKLEALFEYFNGMTEETALTLGSMVTLSGYAQYITKAGTYNIKALNVSSTSYSPLIIESTSESTNITLNIQGNITVNNTNGGTITITGGKISGYRALQNSNSYAYIQGGEIGETNQSTASYIS